MKMMGELPLKATTRPKRELRFQFAFSSFTTARTFLRAIILAIDVEARTSSNHLDAMAEPPRAIERSRLLLSSNSN